MSTLHAMSKLAGIGTIHIEIHPEAQKWAPSNDIIDKLRELVHRPLKVEMFPRSMIPEIWSRDHGNKPFEKEPYSFRAYASGNRCVCFVDETETPESSLWVLLHELAHMELPASKYLFKAYRMATAPNYFESDETHEADPEEQMANMAATQWMNALGFGPVSFPRMWWRDRVNEMTKEAKKSCGGCSYCESVKKLRPKKKLVKEAKMSMPTKVVGIITAASLLGAMSDYRKGFKNRKLRANLPKLLTDPKTSVDASSFLAQIDPKVTVVDEIEKIIPIIETHEAFPASFRAKVKKLNKKDKREVAAALFKHFTTNNAVAMANKDGSRPVIICAKRVPLAVILHEYGHTLDYKHKGHGAGGYGSSWDKLTQNWSRKSYNKVIYDAETTAWNNAEKAIKKNAPEQYNKKTWDKTRKAALDSYSSSFHAGRGRKLSSIGLLGGVLTGLSMAEDIDNANFEKAKKERKAREKREQEKRNNRKNNSDSFHSWENDDIFEGFGRW